MYGKQMALRKPIESSHEVWEQIVGHPVTAEELLEIRHNVGQFMLLLYDWSLSLSAKDKSQEEKMVKSDKGLRTAKASRKRLPGQKRRDGVPPDIYALEKSNVETYGSHALARKKHGYARPGRHQHQDQVLGAGK